MWEAEEKESRPRATCKTVGTRAGAPGLRLHIYGMAINAVLGCYLRPGAHQLLPLPLCLYNPYLIPPLRNKPRTPCFGKPCDSVHAEAGFEQSFALCPGGKQPGDDTEAALGVSVICARISKECLHPMDAQSRRHLLQALGTESSAGRCQLWPEDHGLAL